VIHMLLPSFAPAAARAEESLRASRLSTPRAFCHDAADGMRMVEGKDRASASRQRCSFERYEARRAPILTEFRASRSLLRCPSDVLRSCPPSRSYC